MKTSIILAALLFFVAMPDAHAQNVATSQCPNNPNVPVTVKAIFEDPVYDYTADIPQLTNLSRDIVHVIPESLTLGLTHYQPALMVNPASSARDLRDGTTCVRVDHVDIIFGYKNVTVYIAREIPQATCGFNQVMAHEQKHVMVQKQILNEFIPILQQKIQAYLAENGAMQRQNYGEAVTWLREQVETVAKNAITDIIKENIRLQSSIDTVEEYTTVGNSCGGQLYEVVRSFMQTGQ